MVINNICQSRAMYKFGKRHRGSANDQGRAPVIAMLHQYIWTSIKMSMHALKFSFDVSSPRTKQRRPERTTVGEHSERYTKVRVVADTSAMLPTCSYKHRRYIFNEIILLTVWMSHRRCSLMLPKCCTKYR